MSSRKSQPGRVIVITDRRDAHLAFVERHLDAPLVVIDPLDIITGTELTLSMHAGKIVVTYDGELLDNVRGVWFRKPQAVPLDNLPVPEEYKLYSKWAIQRLADSLYVAFEDAVWVSDYYRVIRAESKALQLATAQRLDLSVLPTIFTSNKTAAQEFLESNPKSITKPLTVSFPESRGKTRLFFTTVIGEGSAPDFTNLNLAPAIFQRAVDTVLDIRVTVVGGRVFAASARAKEPQGTVSRISDFRFGHYEGGVIIERHDGFPAELAQKSIELTKALGLRYSALDFVLDKRGTYWFLESNPNGQWAFIERDTGQPIGKALADLLQGTSQTLCPNVRLGDK